MMSRRSPPTRIPGSPSFQPLIKRPGIADVNGAFRRRDESNSVPSGSVPT